MFSRIIVLLLLSKNAICASPTYNYIIGGLTEHSEAVLSAAKAVHIESNNNWKIEFQHLDVPPHNSYESLKGVCSLLQIPAVAIFGPSSKHNLEIVQSVCNSREIPHILTDYIGPLSENQVSFHPNVDLLIKAYVDIITGLNWKQFTYIHSSSESSAIFGKFIEKAQNNSLLVNTEYITDQVPPAEWGSFIAKIKKSGGKFFVVDIADTLILQLLEEFHRFGLITSGYNYFFTSLRNDNTNQVKFDKILSKEFGSSGANIIMIQQLNVMMFSDAQAVTYDAVRMFSKSLKHVKPILNVNVDCKNGTVWNDGIKLINHMVSNHHTGITGQIQFGKDRYRNMFTLYVGTLEPSGLREIATWNPKEGFCKKPTRNTEEVVDNSLNKPLLVVTALKEPYVMLKDRKINLEGNDKYEGYAIDLLYEISEMIHFNFTIDLKPTTMVGRYDPTGKKWNGMIGDLVTKKADLAILDITITSERAEAVEFTLPYMYTGISIISAKPIHAPPPFLTYFSRPFASDFWAAIGIAVVVVTISLFIIGRLCRREWQRRSPVSNYVINTLTFVNTIWYVVGALFRQNTQTKIRSFPGRILAAFWGIFSFILIAMYIGALILHQKEEIEVPLFDDVRSLANNAERYNIKYGAIHGGATMYFFKDSPNSEYQKIYNHMVNNPEQMVNTIPEAVQLLESTRYAFFTEEVTIDYIARRHCDLTKYGGILNERAFGIAVPRDSPYLTKLNKAILKLSNSGTLDQLKRKWWMEKRGGDICKEGEHLEEEATPIGLIEVSELIWLLLFGIFIAFVSAVIEFFIHVYKLNKKRKISFCRAYEQEIKDCFKGNRKKIADPNFKTRPAPRGEGNVSAEAVELTSVAN